MLCIASCTGKPSAAEVVDEWCLLNQKIISAPDPNSRDEGIEELEKLEKQTEKRFPDKEKNREFWSEIEAGTRACIEQHGSYKERLLEDMHR